MPNIDYEVKFKFGDQSEYDSLSGLGLSGPDPDTIYFTTDTQRIYVGDISLNTIVRGVRPLLFDSTYPQGIYYTGQSLTSSSDLYFWDGSTSVCISSYSVVESRLPFTLDKSGSIVDSDDNVPTSKTIIDYLSSELSNYYTKEDSDSKFALSPDTQLRKYAELNNPNDLAGEDAVLKATSRMVLLEGSPNDEYITVKTASEMFGLSSFIAQHINHLNLLIVNNGVRTNCEDIQGIYYDSGVAGYPDKFHGYNIVYRHGSIPITIPQGSEVYLTVYYNSDINITQGLTENNFSNEYRSKLDYLVSLNLGDQKVQASFSETDEGSPSFIVDKPTCDGGQSVADVDLVSTEKFEDELGDKLDTINLNHSSSQPKDNNYIIQINISEKVLNPNNVHQDITYKSLKATDFGIALAGGSEEEDIRRMMKAETDNDYTIYLADLSGEVVQKALLNSEPDPNEVIPESVLIKGNPLLDKNGVLHIDRVCRYIKFTNEEFVAVDSSGVIDLGNYYANSIQATLVNGGTVSSGISSGIVDISNILEAYTQGETTVVPDQNDLMVLNYDDSLANINPNGNKIQVANSLSKFNKIAKHVILPDISPQIDIPSDINEDSSRRSSEYFITDVTSQGYNPEDFVLEGKEVTLSFNHSAIDAQEVKVSFTSVGDSKYLPTFEVTLQGGSTLEYPYTSTDDVQLRNCEVYDITGGVPGSLVSDNKLQASHKYRVYLYDINTNYDPTISISVMSCILNIPSGYDWEEDLLLSGRDTYESVTDNTYCKTPDIVANYKIENNKSIYIKYSEYYESILINRHLSFTDESNHSNYDLSTLYKNYFNISPNVTGITTLTIYSPYSTSEFIYRSINMYTDYVAVFKNHDNDNYYYVPVNHSFGFPKTTTSVDSDEYRSEGRKMFLLEDSFLNFDFDMYLVKHENGFTNNDLFGGIDISFKIREVKISGDSPVGNTYDFRGLYIKPYTNSYISISGVKDEVSDVVTD